VLHLRVSTPSDLTDDVIALLEGAAYVSAVAVHRNACIKPPGDIVTADIAREGANEALDGLRALGVHRCGTVHVEQVDTWLSHGAYEAERQAPGSSADAVVWAQVGSKAYEDSELNWTYLSFMTMATLLAGIAIILDSPILTVGAMVLGPEFGAVAAIGLALVRRRGHLLALAARTLLVGFGVAILVTTVVTLCGRALGWVTRDDIVGSRPGTHFIYSPDKWSFVVAVIAAAAGVLSLTSAKVGGLSGVFISVTTIPAAGNVGLGLAFGAWGEIRGSALQLALNIVGMAIAGWMTLALQQAIWSRVTPRSKAMLGRAPQ
jgi:uncharacterized hydrophobic protein (TIGR00271 family)